MLNSLSQTLLKLTTPGVPDIYQGNEIWDFSLVDPDSRRPVDFNLRKALLKDLSLENALNSIEEGKIKLFLIRNTLQLRQELPELFAKGSYLPLTVIGPMQEHIIAFARLHGSDAIIVIAGRYFSLSMKNFHETLDSDSWKNTYIELPQELVNGQFENIFTGAIINSPQRMPIQELMAPMQQAVLKKIKFLV